MTMPKTKTSAKAAAPAAESLSIVASVPIGAGVGRWQSGDAAGHTAGWTGNAVQAGDTLTTTDAALHARLIRLGYGRAVASSTSS